MSSARNFWGTLFIIVGLLWLISAIGIAFNPIKILAPVWFVVLIVSGILYMVKIRWLATIFLILAILAAISNASTNVDVKYGSEHREFVQQLQANETIDEIELSLHFGAGKISIEGDESVNAYRNDVSSYSKLDPTLRSVLRNNKMHIDVKRDSANPGLMNLGNEEWAIQISNSKVYDINLDYGAADSVIDLRDVMLRNLKIETGASSTKLYLPDTNSSVEIGMGAADMKIFLPRESQTRIEITSGIVSKDFDGFEKIQNNLFLTENFNSSEDAIIIKIDAGVSNIQTQFY